MRKMTRYVPVLAVALIALLLPAPVEAQTEINETRAANADMHLSIDEIIVGRLVIVGWDRNEMQITGTVGADVGELEIDGGP